MKRDKIISVRVNSALLNEVQNIIDSKTHSFEMRGRNYYRYKDEKGISYEKFTIADLLESAMQEYIEKHSKKE